MAFVTDKEELKPGLIIFRRGDVAHRRWYCRVKLPKADRYKTYSLKTTDISSAREMAQEKADDVRYALKYNGAVFIRPFNEVAEEYAKIIDGRARSGEITLQRAAAVRSVIKCQLNRYVGPIQVHLIGQDRWTGYPAWRRLSGQGRVARIGSTRPFTPEEKAEIEAKESAALAKRRPKKRKKKVETPPKAKREEWVIVSDSTICFEMKILRAIQAYAISKKYLSADNAFGELPDLEVMRRDAFSREEYRALHTRGRAWVRAANPTDSEEQWTRAVVYNFVLIMCNTGMRPIEGKNVRWRDLTPDKDREEREIVVVWVHGKDKQRRLVAPATVGGYFERIRELSKELRPNIVLNAGDRVFTEFDGDQDPKLYAGYVHDLLTFAELLTGPSGSPRSTYCFRHTYATFRLEEGVDVYFLAEQMGTSVQEIEDHYGHVNTIRYADRVLQGMSGWDPPSDEGEEMAKPRAQSSSSPVGPDADAAARQAIKAKQPAGAPAPRRIGSGKSFSKRSRRRGP